MRRKTEDCNRADMDASVRPRGQSEIVAVVVLIGFVLVVAVGVAVIGFTALGQLEGQSQSEAASQSLEQAKVEFASLEEGDVTELQMSESIAADTTTHPDEGTMTISVEGFDEISNETFYLGSLVYENDGSHLGYQGGGVWKKTDDRTQMVSAPDFDIQTSEVEPWSLRFDVQSIQGYSESQSNGITATSMGHNETALGLPHRLPAGPMVIEIESEYYDGWGQYFAENEGIEKGTDGEVGTVTLDDDEQTMTLEVNIDEGIPDVFSARVGNEEAGSQPLSFENGTAVNSYDSQALTEGAPTDGDFTDSAAIATWSGTAASVNTELYLGGDLYNTLGQHSEGEGDQIELHDGAVITGDIHSNYQTDLGAASVYGTVYANHSGAQPSVTLDGGYVGEDVHTHNAVLSGNSTIAGDVYAKGDVSIEGSVNISGDLKVGGEIDGNDSGVGGTVTEQDQDVVIENPTDDIAPEAADQVYPDDPQAFPCDNTDNRTDEEIVIDEPCTVESGAYKAKSITIEDGGELVLDTEDGGVLIHLTHSFDIEEGGSVEKPENPYDSTEVEVIVEGEGSANDDVTVELNEDFVGLIDTRYNEVELTNRATIYGAVLANTIELDDDTALYFDERLLVEDGEDLRFARADEYVFFDISITDIELD